MKLLIFNMRILGIDPGTATTGFGIIENCNDTYKVVKFGCIKTEPQVAMEKRLNEISQDLNHIIKTFKPDEAAVEEIFFSKNAKTAISVAQARGVIMQKLNENNIPVKSYNPLQIKLALCSTGKAKKPQVQKMIKILLQLDEIPSSDDSADALAIALCHGNFIRNKALYS